MISHKKISTLLKSLLFLHTSLGYPTLAMDIEDKGKEPLVEKASFSFPALGEEKHQQQDDLQEALLKNILRATGAEYNWPGHVRKLLEPLACSASDPALKSKAEQVIAGLKQPEDLLFFAPHEDKTVLYRSGLTAEHSVFQAFRVLLDQIDALSNQLAARLPLEARSKRAAIKRDLEQLKQFYKRFIDNLCAGNPDQKGALLEPKVFLTLENPLESYRISQGIARQLISKDRYGFTEKKNKTGLNAVQSRNGVHFKLLATSLDDPDSGGPGVEYMAYALANVLTPQFLLTPTTLLKLEGVLLPKDILPEITLARIEGKDLDKVADELYMAKGKASSLSETVFASRLPAPSACRISPEPSKQIPDSREIP